jgi:hypothetical protein
VQGPVLWPTPYIHTFLWVFNSAHNLLKFEAEHTRIEYFKEVDVPHLTRPCLGVYEYKIGLRLILDIGNSFTIDLFSNVL